MTHVDPKSLKTFGLIAVIFGVMTVFAGGTALFGGAGVQQAVGDAVPLVLKFNFAAGFAYILAGFGLLLARPWAVWVSAAIAVGSAIVLGYLALYVMQGGAYEPRTVLAMGFRTLVWGVIFVISRRVLLR